MPRSSMDARRSCGGSLQSTQRMDLQRNNQKLQRRKSTVKLKVVFHSDGTLQTRIRIVDM